MTGRLAGRVVLVTGSTGIAAAAAERLAQEDARVFIVSRTPDHSRSIAERLSAGGAEAGWHAADLTVEPEVAGAVGACVDAFGRVDGLLSVAGGSGRRFGDGPLHEVTVEGWEATLRLNLLSQFLVTRAILNRLLDQDVPPDGERGSVVLMGSVTAFRPAPGHYATHAYAAAKAAIAGLVAATSAYYAPSGIRINAIAPGAVDTPMAARAMADPPTVDYTARRQPLRGGFLAPDDVAGTAIWLLSPESRAVTGQVVAVDAGWSVGDSSGWPGPAR